jgi:hypothetical protein
MKAKATALGLAPLIVALLLTLIITMSSCASSGYCKSWNNPSATGQIENSHPNPAAAM